MSGVLENKNERLRSDSDDVLVTVRTMVYNQEHYLRDCFEGILSQKTKFRYEVIIHDDASTDNSRQIIQEYALKYPLIFKPIFQKKNLFSVPGGKKKMYELIMSKTRGRYVAICEGDDYWTDPYKLQKQVDFLESHPEYTMVYTDFKVVDKDNHLISDDIHTWCSLKSGSGNQFSRLLRSNYIMTLTVLYRREIEENEIFKRSFRLDYSTFLTCAACGPLYYIDYPTACYRRHSQGITTSNNQYVSDRCLKILESFKLFFIEGKIDKITNKEKVEVFCRVILENLSKKMDRKKYLKIIYHNRRIWHLLPLVILKVPTILFKEKVFKMR